MTRTTPPRPLDIADAFPELTAYATTATRLHPRPGAPAVGDSSIAGPLLWPADEPWPVCEDGGDHYVNRLLTPQTVRHMRAVYASGDFDDLTEDDKAQVPDYDYSEPESLVEQPIPLIPVAQLYRRDTPDFAGPDDADVLQVLWCPLDHPELGYNPSVRVYWRRSDEIGRLLDAAPEPPVVNDDYFPTPCVVHPEQIREFPYAGLLPDDLKSRIRAWEQKHDGSGYQYDLSLAPGWKVGGYANWSLTDPYPMNCADCGTTMTLLFTADSGEWQGGDTSSWRPVEETSQASPGPTDVVIGRGYALYVFRCPASFDHPVATAMQ
ncbi:MAG: hypothetical protein HOU81_00255 [Hamadaea sp.]|uniref:hypothetical protein n=1 Tax=Hamadaea sp. TaxID=2024425 RepID=UPI0017AAB998|nr:hypothetical protein [Hamadaea sp.]NUR69249.1 hypothetical protein [Hamadaea sp.]NUT21111.1 hypothetical protein [Hamadaea sp.]